MQNKLVWWYRNYFDCACDDTTTPSETQNIMRFMWDKDLINGVSASQSLNSNEQFGFDCLSTATVKITFTASNFDWIKNNVSAYYNEVMSANYTQNTCFFTWLCKMYSDTDWRVMDTFKVVSMTHDRDKWTIEANDLLQATDSTHASDVVYDSTTGAVTSGNENQIIGGYPTLDSPTTDLYGGIDHVLHTRTGSGTTADPYLIKSAFPISLLCAVYSSNVANISQDLNNISLLTLPWKYSEIENNIQDNRSWGTTDFSKYLVEIYGGDSQLTTRFSASNSELKQYITDLQTLCMFSAVYCGWNGKIGTITTAHTSANGETDDGMYDYSNAICRFITLQGYKNPAKSVTSGHERTIPEYIDNTMYKSLTLDDNDIVPAEKSVTVQQYNGTTTKATIRNYQYFHPDNSDLNKVVDTSSYYPQYVQTIDGLSTGGFVDNKDNGLSYAPLRSTLGIWEASDDPVNYYTNKGWHLLRYRPYTMKLFEDYNIQVGDIIQIVKDRTAQFVKDVVGDAYYVGAKNPITELHLDTSAFTDDDFTSGIVNWLIEPTLSMSSVEGNARLKHFKSFWFSDRQGNIGEMLSFTGIINATEHECRMYLSFPSHWFVSDRNIPNNYILENGTKIKPKKLYKIKRTTRTSIYFTEDADHCEISYDQSNVPIKVQSIVMSKTISNSGVELSAKGVVDAGASTSAKYMTDTSVLNGYKFTSHAYSDYDGYHFTSADN